MKGSVLVVGYNSRIVACSAHRAGYKVYSYGHYNDLDLEQCVSGSALFGEMPGVEQVKEVIEKFKIDYVVPTSGFEDIDLPASMILGNDPGIARNVVNKLWFARKLKELGIRHPKIYTKDDVEFPCVAKPIRGGGGYRNFMVKDESMLPDLNEYFLQEFVAGKPLSVCVMSTGTEAMPVSINEILVGKKWLGQEQQFGYCGNVTPYRTRFHDEMFDIARKLIPELKLVGTNGIDFIVDEKGPCVLEVNPRFQGSLDSVELATGENIFQAHVDAINGKLREFRPRQYGVRGIVFARRPTQVVANMLMPMIADVPRVGNVFEKGEAIVSVLGCGKTRAIAMEMLKDNLRFVKKNIRQHRSLMIQYSSPVA